MKFRGRDAMTNFRPVQVTDPEAVFLLEQSKRQASMRVTSPQTPAGMVPNPPNESDDPPSLPPKPTMQREHLFEKAVTPSDVGKLNRLVIPKQHAERCFPLDLALNVPCQTLSFEDVSGKHWRFRYSYWNSSQSYVFTKSWSCFLKGKKLEAGDTVSFERGPNQELYIDFRRRLNNQVAQMLPGPSTSASDFARNREHLFEKAVTPSDVGKLNRLVIPKQHAERCFPLDLALNAPCQTLSFEDVSGKHWRFRYSYWNSSQSYVFTKGWSCFLKGKKLEAGDTVSFERGPNQELYIDFRRRLNNQVAQMLPGPSTSASDFARNRPWVPRLPNPAGGLNPAVWHQLSLQNPQSSLESREQLQMLYVRQAFPQRQQQQHMESGVSLPHQTRTGDDFFSLLTHGRVAAMDRTVVGASTTVVKQQQLLAEGPVSTPSAAPAGASGGTRLFGVDLENTSSSSAQGSTEREYAVVSGLNDWKSQTYAQQLQSLSRASYHQGESSFQQQQQQQHLPTARILPSFQGSLHGQSPAPVLMAASAKQQQQQQEQSPFMGLSIVRGRAGEQSLGTRLAASHSDLQLASSTNMNSGSAARAAGAGAELQEAGARTVVALGLAGPQQFAGDSRKRKVGILECLKNSGTADSYARVGAPDTSLSLAQHSESTTQVSFTTESSHFSSSTQPSGSSSTAEDRELKSPK
uniref:Uncharacterized protein M2D3.2 n=1 Tax=Marchantia polymorpha TaxID=3197 RepID=Q8H6E4_MARPO|nr:hypothetical protein [Marchantia polymorpha]